MRGLKRSENGSRSRWRRLRSERGSGRLKSPPQPCDDGRARAVRPATGDPRRCSELRARKILADEGFESQAFYFHDKDGADGGVTATSALGVASECVTRKFSALRQTTYPRELPICKARCEMPHAGFRSAGRWRRGASRDPPGMPNCRRIHPARRISHAGRDYTDEVALKTRCETS